jgi:branched-chain amino acid transport system permease protein
VKVIGQLFFDGLAMGLVYVIIAVGMVLMMSVNKILFVAYGMFYTVGAYFTWYFAKSLGLPYPLAVIVSAIGAGVIGMLCQVLIFRRLQNPDNSGSGFLSTLIASLGIMLVLNQAIILVFGTVPRSLPQAIPGSLQLGEVSVTFAKVILIVLGVVITALLFTLVMKTKTGRAMRTAAFLPDVATLHGINPQYIYLVTLGLSCATAGLAGGLLAPTYGISQSMGNNVVWTVMLMVYVGGMDSLWGAVLGGLVIGELFSYGQYYIGGFIQVIVFLVVGLIVYLKPNGLLGRGIDIGI